MKWSVVLSGKVHKISGPLWFRDFRRVAEMKTPGFSLGGIRMKNIRGTAHVRWEVKPDRVGLGTLEVGQYRNGSTRQEDRRRCVT